MNIETACVRWILEWCLSSGWIRAYSDRPTDYRTVPVEDLRSGRVRLQHLIRREPFYTSVKNRAFFNCSASWNARRITISDNNNSRKKWGRLKDIPTVYNEEVKTDVKLLEGLVSGVKYEKYSNPLKKTKTTDGNGGWKPSSFLQW